MLQKQRDGRCTHSMGFCTRTQPPTPRHCANCGVFYESRVCQEEDAALHKRLCSFYRRDLLGRGLLQLMRDERDRFARRVNLSGDCDYYDDDGWRHLLSPYFAGSAKLVCLLCRRNDEEAPPLKDFTTIELDMNICYSRCGECTTKGRKLCQWSFLPIDECVARPDRLVECCRLETGGEPTPLIL